ncbi:hypothetical protein ACHAW6_015441 [Cyclotella cf. meneghiniana]
MAAKQGLTAQIYQASEDTKRSLLSRAPTSIKAHSWLSNLNTTCTIKSAPPRTPEVMSLLSSKCGWLVKRNEQHVWQKRWCCVVPHTFLYYFEAGPEVKPDEDGNYDGWSGGGVNVKGAASAQVIAVGPLVFQNLDQDALNLAVKEGYVDDVPGSKLSFYASLPNLPFVGNGHHAHVAGEEDGENILSSDWEETPMSMDGENRGKYQFVSSNLQPVGIIDLECYSAVNRSKINPTVLELAGDSITNPDLRAFYFQSATIEDAESWTKALLSDRHQSLKDETDAYRQVCDSFPLQLQACSEMIDAAEAKAEEMEKEAYSVRSAAEEGRRKVVSTVREILERQCWETEASNKQKRGGRNGPVKDAFDEHTLSGRSRSSRSARSDCSLEDKETSLLDSVLDEQYAKLETNREAFLKELEATLSSPSAVVTSNVVPPVQTLADYTSAIASAFSDLRIQLRKYEIELSQSVQQDQTELNKLKHEIERRDAMLDDAEKRHSHMLSEMKSQLEQYRHEVAELTKQLDAQRMEFGMYQNATKNKVSELHQHKKILKKEVIELRKKIDECGSETTTVAHKYEKIKNSYQAEKERNATLERYIERLEKQVGVQQNMMEMMSTSGASFVGKMVGPGLTQCESKDNISLSGMSAGSHYRRASSNSVVGGHSTTGGTNASSQHIKPRILLPPESAKKHRTIEEVSPLRSPNTTKDENIGDVIVAEERDASTAYYRSDTATEVESPCEGAESTTSHQEKPSISIDDKDLGTADVVLSPIGDDDPVLSHRSTESLMKSPTLSPGTGNKTAPVESSKTPVQSNSLLDESLSIDVDSSKPRNGTSLPRVDTSMDASLNNPLPLANFPHTDHDDEDDIKSRVSDITEDRTQRQIDDDLAERRKILLAYVHGNAGGSSNTSLSASTQRRLETIENMIPNGNGGSVSRGGLLPRVGSIGSIESHGGSSHDSGKLSVAQRARLAAESRVNSHRSPSPMRQKDDASHSSNNLKLPIRDASPAPLERSGSFLSKLGKSIGNLVDNTIVGVKSWESEYDEEERSESETSGSLSGTSGQSTKITLQERIAMQRQKQVEFLKNKGVIDDESSLQGGAGGSSIVSPRSPTPSNRSGRLVTPRRGVGRSWSRN